MKCFCVFVAACMGWGLCEVATESSSGDLSQCHVLVEEQEAACQVAVESEQYVIERFSGNKVELAGVTVKIVPFGPQSQPFPLEIVTKHPVDRRDEFTIYCEGVTLLVKGEQLSAGGIDYPIKRGDHIVDNNGVVFINGIKRTQVTFEDAYYLVNSRLNRKSHKVLKGDRTLVLWREFSSNPHWTDTQHYKMLTIELENPHSGKVFALPSEHARGFYSDGSPVWDLRRYCESPRGTVRIDQWGADESAAVTFDLTLPLSGSTPNRERNDGKAIRFSKTLRISKITQKDLTPWLNGESGFRPNSEPRAIPENDEEAGQ